MAAPISHILNDADSQAPSPSRPSHLRIAANALNTIRDGAALMSFGASEAAYALLALVEEDSQLADRRIDAEARAANEGLGAMNQEDSTEAQGRHSSTSPDEYDFAFNDLKRGAPNKLDTIPTPPSKRRKIIPKEQATDMSEFRASRRRNLPPVPPFPCTDTPSQKRKTPDDEDERPAPSQPAKRARRSRAKSTKKGKQRAASPPADPSAPRTETPRDTYLQTKDGQATEGRKVVTGEKAIKAINPLQLTSPVASYKKSSLGKKHRDAAVARLAELASGSGEPNSLVDAETETAQIRRSLAALDDEHTTHYPRTLASAETQARWNIPRPEIDEANVVPIGDFVPRAPSEKDESGLITPERFAEMFAPQQDKHDTRTFMKDEVENEARYMKWDDEATKKLIREKQKREDKENEREAREGREITVAANRKAIRSTKKGKQGLKGVEAGKEVEKENEEVKTNEEVKDAEDMKEVEVTKEDVKETEETPPETGKRIRKPTMRQLEMEEKGIGRKKK